MTLPADPAERAGLLAEYVLGTLDARAAGLVARAMEHDAALRAEIDALERRFAPLSALAPPEAPPEGLWARIEAGIAPAAPAAVRAPRLWRFWAIGATLAAAAFAGLAVLPRVWPVPGAGPAARYMTVLVSDRSAPALLAETDPTGALRVQAVASLDGTRPAAPAGRSLELWGVAPGAPAPVSFGVLPQGGGAVRVPASLARPVEGMQILITVEPQGGSPSGKPTGPVVFFGRLSRLGPPT